MKPKLLFVDDESQILEGIQDSLRKYRKQWDMSFVCGGEAAIVELEACNFDVVISDMRMPVVDGVDVLMFAKLHCPATIRIMLSGYSEIEHTIKVSSLAHRYLTKPCDLEELEATVRRSLELSKKLNDDTIKDAAGKIDLLPVGTSQRQILLELINRDDMSINDIAHIIESDIAMTTKVLHLVNSAFFRRQRTIESAREAAAYLGTDLIKSIVLADQLFSLAEGNKFIDKEWLDRLQSHSWLTASIAKHLLQDTKYAEAAFTAGLLHEIGILVLGIQPPEIGNSMAVSKSDPNNADVDAPVDSNTAMQVQLGAYLLNLWGIPYGIVEAVAFYQSPSELGHDEFDLVAAVHVANYLAEVCLLGENKRQLGESLDTDFLKALNLEDQLDVWMTSALLIASDSEAGITSTHSERAA